MKCLFNFVAATSIAFRITKHELRIFQNATKEIDALYSALQSSPDFHNNVNLSHSPDAPPATSENGQDPWTNRWVRLPMSVNHPL